MQLLQLVRIVVKLFFRSIFCGSITNCVFACRELPAVARSLPRRFHFDGLSELYFLFRFLFCFPCASIFALLLEKITFGQEFVYSDVEATIVDRADNAVR